MNRSLGSVGRRGILALRGAGLASAWVLILHLFSQPDPRMGGLVTLFRAVLLPAAVVVDAFTADSRIWLVLLAIAAVALATVREVDRSSAGWRSLRGGALGVARELYCWAHALILLPVALTLTLSGASHVLPPAIVLLYVFHFASFRPLARVRAVAGWATSLASVGLLVVVCGVLWAIAPSQGLLVIAAATLASRHATAPHGSTAGIRALWAVGLVLVAASDQWLFAVAAIGDTFVAWRLGFFSVERTRSMRAAPLAALIASQILLGRGLAFLMGFHHLDRIAIERQPGVRVVLPYPVVRDRSLGEHLTLAAPACDGDGAIVGSISTSRWVGGGPDAIQPRIRRIDRNGQVVAQSPVVIEPSYSSVLDCERGVLAVGEAMDALVTVLDARSLEVRARIQLACDPRVVAVSELAPLGLWAVTCGPTMLIDADTYRVAGQVGVGAFDATTNRRGFEIVSPVGAFQVDASKDHRGLRIGSVFKRATWEHSALIATAWGTVAASMSTLTRYAPHSFEPEEHAQVGVWIRYLKGHPTLPFVVASDYLRGRVYLIHLPDLAVRGSWYVGERPRQGWLDRDGATIWVGAAAGVVRIDVAAFTRD